MVQNNSHSLTYNDLRRLVIFIIILFLTYQFIRIAAAILVLFGLVFLVALLLTPFVSWLQTKGLNRTFASVLAIVLLVFSISIIVTVALPPIVNQINELIQQLPNITEQLTKVVKQFSKRLPFLGNFSAQFDIGKFLSAPKTLQSVAKIGQNVLGAIFFNFLALFLIGFILINPKPVVLGFLNLFPNEIIPRISQSLVLLSRNLSTWFLSTLLIGIVDGVIAGIGLVIIGLDFSIVFAALLILAEFVPFVGPLSIGLVATVFGLAQSPIIALLTAIIFIAVQSLESIIWAPLIFAYNLKLHPVSIVFGILVGELLVGLAGALLAIPALIAIKIIYEEFFQKESKDLELETEKVINLKA